MSSRISVSFSCRFARLNLVKYFRRIELHLNFLTWMINICPRLLCHLVNNLLVSNEILLMPPSLGGCLLRLCHTQRIDFAHCKKNHPKIDVNIISSFERTFSINRVVHAETHN